VIDRVGRVGVKFVVMLCIRIVRKRDGRCCGLGNVAWECWSKDSQWKLKWSIGDCWNIG
jgi:hypothetical protein